MRCDRSPLSVPSSLPTSPNEPRFCTGKMTVPVHREVQKMAKRQLLRPSEVAKYVTAPDLAEPRFCMGKMTVTVHRELQMRDV